MLWSLLTQPPMASRSNAMTQLYVYVRAAIHGDLGLALLPQHGQ